MLQRIGAALFAAALIGAASGVARAQQRPIVHRVLQTQTLASIAERELRDLEIAGNMPTANADLEMWSDDEPTIKNADPIHRLARGIINRTSSIALSLTRSAMRFIGTPYVFGGTTPAGFDCSGYVQYVFAMFGIHLPRTEDAETSSVVSRNDENSIALKLR